MSLAPPISTVSQQSIRVFETGESCWHRDNEPARFPWFASAIQFALLPVCIPLYLQTPDSIDLEACIPLGT